MKNREPAGILKLLITVTLVLFLSGILIIGCSGGSGGSGDVGSGGGNAGGDEDTWSINKIRELTENETGGLLMENIKAVNQSNNVHLAFFIDNGSGYSINYLFFDSSDPLSSSEETVLSTVDNCMGLDLTLSSSGTPIVAYQGGVVREAGQERQSDIMMSIRSGADDWNEYRAAIGNVERNPVFTDGLAGSDLTLTSGDNGALHFGYQFYYEGIDAQNSAFPDMNYVAKDSSAPGTVFDSENPVNPVELEEGVETNIYNPNGTASDQHYAGGNCKIITDSNNEPVMFYYANLDNSGLTDDDKGIRIAKKTGIDGEWESEWLPAGFGEEARGFEVDCLSVAKKSDGSLGITYTVKDYDTGQEVLDYCLIYAEESNGWTPVLIGNLLSYNGRFSSLAYDENDLPAVAYFRELNRSGNTFYSDLYLDRKTSSGSWNRELVANASALGMNNNKIVNEPESSFFYIGKYNNLWFDNSGTANIISYSTINDSIYYFVK